jgi:predicted nucleic acid-binding protein
MTEEELRRAVELEVVVETLMHRSRKLSTGTFHCEHTRENVMDDVKLWRRELMRLLRAGSYADCVVAETCRSLTESVHELAKVDSSVVEEERLYLLSCVSHLTRRRSSLFFEEGEEAYFP